MMQYSIIVPTLNAAKIWPAWVSALRTQGKLPEQIIVVDSSSDDGTAELARREGFRVYEISRSQFNHGGTRQFALELSRNAEIMVYLTQDAILANVEALERIIGAFDDPLIGAAYGRQLPRRGAGVVESHARSFNYPQRSQVRSLDDRNRLGLKTAFISNSFAAYRRSALEAVGGFPDGVILGEDTYVAGKMLLSGWKIAYVADAMVYHSHGYSYLQEFKRYFDIGVLHSQQSWLLEEFGKASGEGKRFVASEFVTLFPRYFWLVPSALIRTFLKMVGYKAGLLERHISRKLKQRLSMHNGYWKTQPAENLGKIKSSVPDV